jgi:hypothetical protein
MAGTIYPNVLICASASDAMNRMDGNYQTNVEPETGALVGESSLGTPSSATAASVGGVQSASDVTAPVLTSLFLPDANVSRGGGTVMFSAGAADLGSGVSFVRVSYSPNTLGSNFPSELVFSQNNDSFTDGVSKLYKTIGSDAIDGNYVVTSVYVEDLAGNGRSYSTIELAQLGFDNSFRVWNEPGAVTAVLTAPTTIKEGEGTAKVIVTVLHTQSYPGNYNFSMTSPYGYSSGSGSGGGSYDSAQDVVLTFDLPVINDNVYRPTYNLTVRVQVIGQIFANGTDTVALTIPVTDDDAQTSDFNGDGRSDVLLQNSATGAISVWRAQANGALSDAGNLSANSLDASWKVAGIGDFNGDGRADILWRHSSGVLGEWTGQSGVFQNNSGVAANPVDNSWTVVGIADYNGDGRDDILWRHSSGEIGQWLAQPNGGFSNNGGAAANKVDNSWKIVGSGDFNGDGRSDIFWKYGDSLCAVWRGTATGAMINAGDIIGTSASVIGTGDFNGDGRSDVLFRSISGEILEWLGQPDGQFITKYPTLQLTDAAWKVASIGDFNGDGRADLLWQHESGSTAYWLGTATGNFEYGAAGLDVTGSNVIQSPDLLLA